MNLMHIGLIIYSGMAIAAGQGCMTAFARGIPQPFEVLEVLRYCLVAPSFYGFIALYGSGTAAMIYLLRIYPLAQVSISILAVTILCSVAITYWFGESLSVQQLVGIALVFVGVALIQIRI
jgi:drug/metabolite transporter (DMT)-like permease